VEGTLSTGGTAFLDTGPVGGRLVRSLRTTATDDARGLKQAEVVAHFPKQPDIVGHPVDRLYGVSVVAEAEVCLTSCSFATKA